MNQVKQQRHTRPPRGAFGLMYRVYKYILPEVRRTLMHWQMRAKQIPNRGLRMQALASITNKQFHCEGGAVYAAAKLNMRHILIPLTVAFQTISDYLDNLCDRSTSLAADDFRLLHQAMLDAVQPEEPLKDYYAFRAQRGDGNYLRDLVLTCRDSIFSLPAYHITQPNIVRLVKLYTDLQVYKHIHPASREQALLDWWRLHELEYPELRWNEFAAAAGSTLGVFQLFLAATDATLTQTEADYILEAYFPYVCGLHILLDYLIDQEEDRVNGDLNFCNYYDNYSLVVKRIGHFVDLAAKRVSSLPDGRFHHMIIEGLLALYLSDPKVRKQDAVQQVSKRLMKNSPLVRVFFWMNSHWIRKHMC